MDMPRNRYLYTQREVTRHGKTVWYFRKGDGKRIRIKGEYGSAEFIASYSEALHNGLPKLAGAIANSRQCLDGLLTQWLISTPERPIEKRCQRVERQGLIKIF